MYQHIRNLLDDLSKQSNLVETVINHRHVHLMSKLTAVEKVHKCHIELNEFCSLNQYQNQ